MIVGVIWPNACAAGQVDRYLLLGTQPRSAKPHRGDQEQKAVDCR